ncbi:hypothetical protein OHA21_42150 [Actinoplanes sp. NBC_00393]
MSARKASRMAGMVLTLAALLGLAGLGFADAGDPTAAVYATLEFHWT